MNKLHIRAGIATTTGMIVALLASCSTHQIAIRPVGGVAVAPRGAEGTAKARQMLALGQYALALDYYQRALRDAGDDWTIFAGMAACYDQLGRFDLARRYYESALAVAPRNPEAYHQFAAALRARGAAADADRLLAEASALAASSPEEPALLPSKPIIRGNSVRIALADPPLPSAPLKPVVHLERASLGAVNLITRAAPVQVASAGHVRVPIPQDRAKPELPVHIVNGARRQGIAARMRTVLAGEGWRGTTIGTAARAREYSHVSFPSGYAGEAQSFVAALPFPVRLRLAPANAKRLVLLLGRDAARAKTFHDGGQG